MLLQSIERRAQRRQATLQRRCDNNMATTGLCRIPLEIMEQIIKHLNVRDLSSLRQVCRYIESQTFNTVNKRFFSTICTTLKHVSADLETLERARLQRYVKCICLEEGDDFEPERRSQLSEERSKKEGLASLRAVLRERKICPEEIRIRYRRMDRDINPEKATTKIMRDIIMGSGIRIRRMESSSPRDDEDIAIGVLQLSPQYQGQNGHFLQLASARVCLGSDDTWETFSADLLFDAPNLKELTLSVGANWRIPEPVFSLSIYRMYPPFRLTRIELTHSVLSGQTILALTERSRESLTVLCIRAVRLKKGISWSLLLRNLGDCLTHLEHFDLCRLKRGRKLFRVEDLTNEAWTNIDSAYPKGNLQIYERKTGHPDIPWYTVLDYGVKYKGRRANTVLAALASHMGGW